MNQSDKLIFIRDLAKNILNILENEEVSDSDLRDILKLTLEDIVQIVNGTFSYEKEEE